MLLYHSSPKNKTIMAEKPQSPVSGTAATEAPQSPQSNQASPRPCPMNCALCPMPQQIFCATKMLFDLSRAYQEQRQQLADIALSVATLQSQLQSTPDTPQLSIPFIEQS